MRIYSKNNNKNNKYIIICSPTINFNEFESFCLLLTQIRFNIPSFWEPISCSFHDDIHHHQPFAIKYDEIINNNDFYGISPSKEIEGKSRKKKKEIIDVEQKKKKSKRASFVRSLSKMIKPKTVKTEKNKNKVNMKSVDYDNDDAASISHENDENYDISNNVNNKKQQYLQKCKQLKTVFITVCGVFNDNVENMDYYEKCEQLQNEMDHKLSVKNQNGTRPLQLIDEFDINHICVIKKYCN